MPPGKKSSYSIDDDKFDDLLDVEDAGLSSEDQAVVENVVEWHGVKYELELILPNDEFEPADVKKGVERVVKDYRTTIRRQATPALTAVAQSYRDDQAKKSGAYGSAESALDKLNKYVDNALEKFRVDLRKAVAAELKLNAKDLMTVGRLKFKKLKIKPGTFDSEVAMSKDSDDDDKLGAAVKFKKWQYCGAVFCKRTARVGLHKTKKFDEGKLKKLIELLPDDERGGAKKVEGRFIADSESKFRFEFLRKKLPLNAEAARKQLKDGIEEQLGKLPSHLSVEAVDEYSMDSKKWKGEDESKEKETSEKKAPKPLPKPPGRKPQPTPS